VIESSGLYGNLRGGGQDERVNVSSLLLVALVGGLLRAELSGAEEECHQIRDRWHANASDVKYLCFILVERNLKNQGANRVLENPGQADKLN
jgi:hypothetical protein